MSFASAFFRQIVHPAILARRGDLAQLRYEREFKRSQFFSADQLRDLQMSRLRLLLNYAYRNCPFYRTRFQRCGLHPEDIQTLEDFSHFPILEKRDIQQSVTEMIATNWPKSDLIPNHTGGSTGTPLPLFLSRDRKCSRAAATLRHNSWAGWNPGDRSAVIWGAAADMPLDNWTTKLRRWLLREPIWLNAAELTERSMHQFHLALLRYRPRIIQAYARSAALFAQWLEMSKLQPYRPHAIITTAEVLDQSTRTTLERVFQCPVFNRYGCREVSVIASECEAHQGMHIMAEGLYLEIDHTRFSDITNQAGCILVTDLLNFAMPLIRYRIGDIGSWASGACPCGRQLPRLQQIQGRVTDFLVGSDGRLVSGVVLATYVVGNRPSLGQVQIRQIRPGHVIYRVRPGCTFDPVADRNYLLEATRAYLGSVASADVEVVSDLPASASGKYLFSHSQVAIQVLLDMKHQ
jgi:phenylacetate-CoA ligase